MPRIAMRKTVLKRSSVLDIPGVELFLHSDSLSRVGYSDGDAISSCPNLAGTDGRFRMGTADYQPTLTEKLADGNSAISFDGTDDFLFTSHKIIYSITPFTLITKFRLNTLPSVKADNATIFYHRKNSSPWSSWQIAVMKDNDKVRFIAYGIDETWSGIDSDAALSINTWYTVICQIDSNLIKSIYIDTIKQATTETVPDGGILQPDGELRIGAIWQESNRLNGHIKYVLFARGMVSVEQARLIDLYMG